MTGTGPGSVVPPGDDEVWRAIGALQDKMDSLTALAAGAKAVAASVVQTGSAGLSQSNFAISPTPVTVATALITVPPGFSTATIINVVTVVGLNGSSGLDFLAATAVIAGSGGAGVATQAGQGAEVSLTPAAIRTITGLNGGTISVAAQVSTQINTWPASANNLATVNAIAIFRR